MDQKVQGPDRQKRSQVAEFAHLQTLVDLGKWPVPSARTQPSMYRITQVSKHSNISKAPLYLHCKVSKSQRTHEFRSSPLVFADAPIKAPIQKYHLVLHPSVMDQWLQQEPHRQPTSS